MPSPFPGMDPYLEVPAIWEGFHQVFIVECMYFLSQRLGANYLANVGERVELISLDDDAAEQYLPDVSVARQRQNTKPVESPDKSSGGTALAVAPVTIRSLDSVKVRQGYVEIMRLPDHKLITSIELLSPWNKYGEGIGEYRHKRRALVSQGVHVVEIDLLRRGRRTELAEPLPAGDYYAFVFRADRRPEVDVYAWGLRHPLPSIPIPLAAPDADVMLELATVVNLAYDRGNYIRKLRYAAPLPEALPSTEAKWAAEILGQVAGR